MSDFEKNNTEQLNLSNKQMEGLLAFQISEKKKEDPMFGIKVGSDDIFNSLINIIQKEDDSVNCHDFLLYAAGLAGYACQAAVRESMVVKGEKKEEEVFHVVTSKKGEKFFFGDEVNHFLLGNPYSVYRLTAGMYKKVYPTMIVPDIAQIIKKVTACIGSAEYKVCGEALQSELKEMYAIMWKSLRKKLDLYCEKPEEWPVLFAMVLQKGIVATKGIIMPDIGFNFAMECAVYASKIDITSRLE